MGGGGSSSESKTDDSTTITTTTETNIINSDIGVTGASAVELVNILESGAVNARAQDTQRYQTLVQETGKAWTQLIGGAGKLVQSAENIADAGVDLASAGLNAGTDIAFEGSSVARQGLNVAGQTVRSGQAVEKSASQLIAENAPWIAAAAAAAFAFRGLMK